MVYNILHGKMQLLKGNMTKKKIKIHYSSPNSCYAYL